MMKMTKFLTIASGLLIVTDSSTTRYLLVEIGTTDIAPGPRPEYGELGPIVDYVAVDERILRGILHPFQRESCSWLFLFCF